MSKLIFSHDVDHLSSYEHWNDLIVPKFIGRGIVEVARNKIPPRELLFRLRDIVIGKWNNIIELANYNSRMEIDGTFFFGVNAGLGLTYSPSDAKAYVDYVVKQGQKVGIHGVARNSMQSIADERNKFKHVYGYQCAGIRFHYLIQDSSVLLELNKVGYSYDSSLRGDKSASFFQGVAHFPVHLMDGDVMLLNKRYQSVTLKDAVEFSKERISKLIDSRTNFISILFHDRYFCDSHKTWKDWYISIVDWVRSQKIETTTYETALFELKSGCD